MINIVDSVYKEFEIKRDSEHRNRSESHYPSGLCAIVNDKHIGQCRRQLFYSMKNETKSNPMDAYALLKTDIGNMIHEKLNNLIKMSFSRRNDIISIGSDEVIVKWEEEGLKFPISGRIDWRFETVSEKSAIEWKSTYGAGIQRIKRDGIELDKLLQPITYLYQKVLPIDSIYLMYIGRDNGYIYGFRITQNGNELIVEHQNSSKVQAFDISFSNIKDALITVENSLYSEIEPDRDYNAKITSNGTISNSSDWQCRYCAWKDRCLNL